MGGTAERSSRAPCGVGMWVRVMPCGRSGGAGMLAEGVQGRRQNGGQSIFVVMGWCWRVARL